MYMPLLLNDPYTYIHDRTLMCCSLSLLRLFYRGALSSVMRQHAGDRETGGGGDVRETPAVAGELLAMMSGDWDKAVVEADVFWLALHLARYMYTSGSTVCFYSASCMAAMVQLSWLKNLSRMQKAMGSAEAAIVSPNFCPGICVVV